MDNAALAINVASIFAELREVREELRAVREAQRRTNALIARLPDDIAATGKRSAAASKAARKGGASADDRARIGALLPVIRACLKERTFTISDLVKVYAARHEALSALFDANGQSGKQIGRLFARFQGIDIEGLVIRRASDKKEHDGHVWHVVSADFKKSEKVAKAH